MKIKKLKSILSLLAFLPLILVGQTSKTLTLDEAVQLGLSNSQQLKISGTRLDVAKAKTMQYKNALVPNVSLNSSYYRLSDNIDPFVMKSPSGDFIVPQILNQVSNRLSANQVVFSGLRAINFYESAQFLEKAAVLDIDKDRLEIKNNIIAAVYNLYKLVVSAEILEKNTLVLRGRLADVKSYVKAGTALENDQLKVELALSQLEMSQKEVQNALAVAQFNLNILLGLPTETVITLDKNSLFSERNVGDLSTYLNGYSSRPELLATDLRAQSANKMVDVARGGLYPTISLGANAYLNNPNQRLFPPRAIFKGSFDIGVNLSYNITNLFTGKYQIQEAQANVAQVQLMKNQLSDGIKMEVNSAYLAYQTMLEKIKISEKAIAQATENQRVMKNRYENQITTLTELLDADYWVLQSKMNLETHKAEAEVAYFKLMKAVGK